MDVFRPAYNTSTKLPFFQEGVSAGFPSPAADHLEKTLDLNDLCIRKPAATYLVRAQGNSMEGAGIYDGDVLVVDRSVDAMHNSVIIASVDGEFLCKRLDSKIPGHPRLLAENPDYPPIVLKDGDELETFGVVTYVIHDLGV